MRDNLTGGPHVFPHFDSLFTLAFDVLYDFAGNIPTDIGRLELLWNVDLSHNPLLGEYLCQLACMLREFVSYGCWDIFHQHYGWTYSRIAESNTIAPSRTTPPTEFFLLSI